MKSLLRILLSLLVLPLPAAAAQQRDSVPLLPELVSRGTRTAEEATGLSTTSISAASRPSGRFEDLTDALGFVPGVQISDRWNWSLDQRVIIRGAGARANFGLRGIRVVLDGIPQTLPDGQGTMTLADLPSIATITVLRGPGSALHGNAAGGVMVLSSASASGLADGIEATVDGGSHGAFRIAASAAGTTGPLSLALGGSRFVSDGPRLHSGTEQYRLDATARWRAAAGTAILARFSLADDPRADNPGALTPAEFDRDPSLAAPANISRNAGKEVAQRQFALGLDHVSGRISLMTRAWAGDRELRNPLAAPAAEPPGSPELGTCVSLDRTTLGNRTTVSFAPGTAWSLTFGWDLQRADDRRSNRPHRTGIPEGSAWLDQREIMTERGLFAQTLLHISPRWTLRGGARHDAVTLEVADRIAPQAGGRREMTAPSSNLAVEWRKGGTAVWLGRQTVFETPTTTELANRPDGSTGINQELEPQRGHSLELGARHSRPGAQLEAVLWRQKLDETISPVLESGGRSFYDNVGGTRMLGMEAGATIAIGGGIIARASWSRIDAEFADGAVSGGVAVDGNALPGVARQQVRLGVTAELPGLVIGYEHAFRSSIMADDRGTTEVAGWKAGIATVRMATSAASRIQGTLSVDNIFDRPHVSSVIVNGAGARVIEPGAGRTLAIGVRARM